MFSLGYFILLQPPRVECGKYSNTYLEVTPEVIPNVAGSLYGPEGGLKRQTFEENNQMCMHKILLVPCFGI